MQVQFEGGNKTRADAINVATLQRLYTLALLTVSAQARNLYVVINQPKLAVLYNRVTMRS